MTIEEKVREMFRRFRCIPVRCTLTRTGSSKGLPGRLWVSASGRLPPFPIDVKKHSGRLFFGVHDYLVILWRRPASITSLLTVVDVIPKCKIFGEVTWLGHCQFGPTSKTSKKQGRYPGETVYFPLTYWTPPDSLLKRGEKLVGQGFFQRKMMWHNKSTTPIYLLHVPFLKRSLFDSVVW